MLSSHYAFNGLKTRAFEALDHGNQATPTRREIFDKRHPFKSELKP
jgi:hypothetical protein